MIADEDLEKSVHCITLCCMLVIFSFFLSSSNLIQNNVFQKSYENTIGDDRESNSLILIRPGILLGLNWVQTVCKGYNLKILTDKELKGLR